ncbi:MAG: methionine--tRNA ligase [Pseudobdellovibrionaceae bacterium]|nr:methionine--tRNA ligase [Bdellovibrionales bacterium]USN46121.1 MAG: methionine--tRNA ligase [Pseudobdellovibrionaceae bacterium]
MSFYITTPIYYVNDKPHLGHAYCTITADVLNRYHRLFGESTYFLTGVDEHGQKCAQAAKKRGLDPQTHCDDMAPRFVHAWEEMHVEYDQFFRTTSPLHKAAVQKALQQLFDCGDIYPDTYEGWYSVSEEIFYTEKDLVDGKSPTGKPVQKIAEKNYFFKMSKYQDQLIQYIEKNPQFIQPDSRRNEVLGFLKKPLGDLCISRPKSRLEWGIEIPFDKDYVTYVWFDALLNYATGVGYNQEGREQEFDTWWKQTGCTHLLGKDILTTHAVYWPTMLFALGVPLPKQLFAHGWILNKSQEKMSKSEGDVVNPLDMKDVVGVDGLRYWLVRDIHLGNDAPFAPDLVINRINTELANNLGNLLSRTTNLIHKYFDGRTPKGWLENDAATDQLRKIALEAPDKLRADIERMAPSYATEHVVQMLNEANRYLEEKAPWKLVKTDVAAAGKVLYAALDVVRIAGILLQPVMPVKAKELLDRLNCDKRDFDAAKIWGAIDEGTLVEKGDPLFPRIES